MSSHDNEVDYDESGVESTNGNGGNPLYDDIEFGQGNENQNRVSSSGGNGDEPSYNTGFKTNRVLPPNERGDIIVPNVLFISRFRLGSTNEKDVKDLFERFGSLLSINLRHKVVYVEYENDEDAKKAKFETHNNPGLGSDSLIVDFKKENKVKVTY
jgi:hypothetical protein